ncbi:MAG: G5 domain-containing protein [Clostridia bacterium]|nr:G5 domain-containing protein [Clostridia bacterium]
MLEKWKHALLGFITSKQMRAGGIALLTAATIAVVTLLGDSVKTVTVFDGEKTYTVHALDVNMTKVIDNLPLKSDRYKILETTAHENLTEVEIAYSFPVFITNGNRTAELEFTGGTVRDALTLAGFTPDKYDFCQPALDSEITETVYIDYTDIGYVTGTYTEEIPYKTKTVYSSSLTKGKTLMTEGKPGLREVSFTEKTINGVSAEKTVTAKKVLKKAVNAVKTVGTKKVKTAAKAKTEKADKSDSTAVLTSADVKCISTLSPAAPIELDENGVPLHYVSKRTARATAYTYTGHRCATGVQPQPGYIAVNPRVIPYGTKMYIKTANNRYIYGYAVAADTGGFIRNHPTGVDLFMSTESACNAFGVRNVEIYILE